MVSSCTIDISVWYGKLKLDFVRAILQHFRAFSFDTLLLLIVLSIDVYFKHKFNLNLLLLNILKLKKVCGSVGLIQIQDCNLQNKCHYH